MAIHPRSSWRCILAFSRNQEETLYGFALDNLFVLTYPRILIRYNFSTTINFSLTQVLMVALDLRGIFHFNQQPHIHKIH
jgi:hypothetical protein